MSAKKCRTPAQAARRKARILRRAATAPDRRNALDEARELSLWTAKEDRLLRDRRRSDEALLEQATMPGLLARVMAGKARSRKEHPDYELSKQERNLLYHLKGYHGRTHKQAVADLGLSFEAAASDLLSLEKLGLVEESADGVWTTDFQFTELEDKERVQGG